MSSESQNKTSDHTEIGLKTAGLECVRGDRLLFSGLDFQVEPGEILQIEGRNGCGKTSLLRLLCGLMLPNDGDIFWNGRDIQQYRAEFFADLSYLGHHNGIKGELTALENLAFSRALSKDSRVRGNDDKSEDALLEIFDRLALTGFEDLPCRTLSAGQNRRVALARLFSAGTKCWILDEPFTALDKKGIVEVEHFFETHVEQGGIVVLTTHHRLRVDKACYRTLSLEGFAE